MVDGTVAWRQPARRCRSRRTTISSIPPAWRRSPGPRKSRLAWDPPFCKTWWHPCRHTSLASRLRPTSISAGRMSSLWSRPAEFIPRNLAGELRPVLFYRPLDVGEQQPDAVSVDHDGQARPGRSRLRRPCNLRLRAGRSRAGAGAARRLRPGPAVHFDMGRAAQRRPALFVSERPRTPEPFLHPPLAAFLTASAWSARWSIRRPALCRITPRPLALIDAAMQLRGGKGRCR